MCWEVAQLHMLGGRTAAQLLCFKRCAAVSTRERLGLRKRGNCFDAPDIVTQPCCLVVALQVRGAQGDAWRGPARHDQGHPPGAHVLIACLLPLPID